MLGLFLTPYFFYNNDMATFYLSQEDMISWKIELNCIFLVKVVGNAIILHFGHDFSFRYTRNELFENIFLL